MSWITTASGVRVHLSNPLPDTLLIEDIAHALSNICRYTGHTGKFYSVAEHSVLASQYVTDAKFALAALMHDASEAYLGDVSRPLKTLIGKKYRDLETRFEAMIAKKFGFVYPHPDEVKWVDLDLLETEYCQLLAMEEHPLKLGKKLDHLIECWPPAIAEKNFLLRFDVLAGQKEFDFGPQLAKALVGRNEAMAKPLYYICRECGRKHKVGSKPRHGTRRGTKKRQAHDSGRSSKLPRGKRR